MSAVVETFSQRRTRTPRLALEGALIVSGGLLVAAFAQLYVRLPFTPVPITGQTFAVLLVGASLGPIRGGVSLLFYLGCICPGPAVRVGGGRWRRSPRSLFASGGYLWGFVAAALLVGWLAQKGWDRRLGTRDSSLVDVAAEPKRPTLRSLILLRPATRLERIRL